MTIFINESYLYWFDVVNLNISEYTSYFYFINSWVYDTYIEPYSAYKTGVFKRYYLKLKWELLTVKGKTILTGLGNDRFFYYHKGKQLKALSSIKFWFFYKKISYYYYLSEARNFYISDFKLYDNLHWRRNSDFIYADFWSKFRPRHWKFWTQQIRYSDFELIWPIKRRYDVYFFETKTLMRYWFQWDRLYFKDCAGYHRYVQTEYWMMFYCCISGDMYNGQYDNILYNHLNYYHIISKYNFLNLFLIIMPYLYNYIIPFFSIPLFIFKLWLFYIILFYFFNLNYYFYRIYFIISFIFLIAYPKVLQLKFFVKFLQLITNQGVLKENINNYNKNAIRTKYKKIIKTDKERFIEIIQKELKYPDAIFPIFLYYFVYKKTIFQEMLTDICIFSVKSFFYYTKDKKQLKTNIFLNRITKDFDLFNLFFIFNILLLTGFFLVPILLFQKINNILYKLFKYFFYSNLDKLLKLKTIFLKNNIVINNRLIQNHLANASEVHIEDQKNIDIRKTMHKVYTYINPFRRLNEIIYLYIKGFQHMDAFYKNVAKEVEKTEKTKEHLEEFLEPVEQLELLNIFIFFVPYKEYVLPYNYITKLGKFFFIKTKNKFTNWTNRFTVHKVPFFFQLKIEKKSIFEKIKDHSFYTVLMFVHDYIFWFRKYFDLLKYFTLKWLQPLSFFSYCFYYCYYYIFYILFKLINFFLKSYSFYRISGFLLHRFYIIKYYKLIKKFLSHYLLFKILNFIIKLFKILIIKFNLIIKIFFKILLKIESRYFLPFNNMKYFFTYLYFVFIEFNILFKIFIWINLKLFHFFTVFFICTIFIDSTNLYYIYDTMEKVFFVFTYYLNSINFLDFTLSKYFYFSLEKYFFHFYEKNHIFVNISIYDRDFYEFMNKMYERTKYALFWNSYFLNTAVRICADYFNIELNWWIMQYKFILMKFKFTRLANLVYIYNMSTYWLIVLKHYKFFFLFYLYYFFEWIYYYSFFIFLDNILQFYQIDFYNYVNYLVSLEKTIIYFFFKCIVYCKYKFIFIFNNYFNNIDYIFIDYYPYKIQLTQGIKINIFFNWFDYFLKYKIVRFYIIRDILEYLQYISFYYYYMLSSFFSMIVYIINWFLKLLFGNWFDFNLFHIKLRDFMLFLSKLFSPFYVLCDEIFSNFNKKSFNFRYKDDLSWVWPEMEKAFEYGFGVNVDKMIVNSIYIKKSSLYNYIFDLRSSKNYDFHLYMLFMDVFFIFILIFYLTLLTKTFSFMLKNKYFYTFGPFVSWDRLTVKKTNEENAYTKLTDFEWQIVNSIEYATDLRTFKEDVFKFDPFYDYVNNKEVCGFLFYDILKTFVWNKKVKQKSYVYKMILMLENYYFNRYVFFSNILRRKYLNVEQRIFNYKVQSKFFKNNFFYKPRKFFTKYNNYERFSPNICFNYQEWKEMFVVPYLYTYCDDYQFVKKVFDRKNNILLRYLQKFRTIIEEKRYWNIDPIDFVIFERDFYDGIINKFYKGKKYVSKYDAFAQFLKSRRYLDPVFAPIEEIHPHFLSQEIWFFNARANIYKFQEYCYNLAQIDDKYFSDFFNITLFGNFTYPQIVTTRINFELMDSMFNAFDPEQVIEFVPYLPSSFVSTDNTNPYYMHVAVQTYWKETLKYNTKRSTKDVALYDMAFLPEWKLSSLPVFLCIICLGQVALIFNFDDALYSHKQPFQLDSTLSTILIFFVKVLNFGHFILNAQYMDIWYLMPDYGTFITVEDLEFVFLGSTPSIWNFYYSSYSITSEELKWLVSTRMFQYAYGVEIDSYFLLKNWLEFEPREIFESTKNLRWRDFSDKTGTIEMFATNLNVFSSTLIRVWCQLYYYFTLPFSELIGYPISCMIAFFPCYFLICFPFTFLVNYFVHFSLFRKENFYVNYLKYLKKRYDYVNKK